MNNKAQAAMEFLMTYGWAILVVLVAIGALAYFGVLDPSSLLPNSCVFSTGFNCKEFVIGETSVTIAMVNSFGNSVTITGVEITNKLGSCTTSPLLILENGQTGIIKAIGCNNGNTGDKFRGDVLIMYTGDSGLTYTATGEISARVTNAETSASQSICQNAQDAGLCDGLDIVFGVGYKALCWSEFELCP